MKYTTTLKTVMSKSPEGLLVPTGTQQDSIGYQSTSLLSLKSQAEAIELLYREANVALPPTSGLATMLTNAKHVADQWMLNRDRNIPPAVHLLVTHCGQMAECIHALHSVPQRKDYMARLTSGPIDYLTPGSSDAKSVLWELELWNSITKRGIAARLVDPPDIVMAIDGHEIAIACKKLFSEAHVQNVLSQAVRQIRRAGAPGLVAMNIDELVASSAVFVGSTKDQATSAMNSKLMEFLSKHERHFRKYLTSERIIGALVSVGCVTDLKNEKTRLNYTRMSTVWCLPDRSDTQERCLLSLEKAFRN